jgi:outer membrane protein OmpA-like peptidoglycan-associated protein
MIRIAFPVASDPAALEERLKKDGRVDVYGIYFDFAKSSLRPESERVLDEVAAVLKNNPTWKLKIDGHTDNTVAMATTWICRGGVRPPSKPHWRSAIASRQIA